MRKRVKSQYETSQASTTMYRTSQSFRHKTRPTTTNSQLQNNDSSQADIKLMSYYHSKYEQPNSPWRQSAGTWTRSSATCSFPKQKRFITPKPACLYNLQLKNESFLSKRGTSQGFGRKSQFLDNIVKRTKDLMESEIFYTEDNECYDLTQRKTCRRQHQRPTSTNAANRGKTFGCSWEEYRKNGVIGVDFQITNENPGVGAYSPKYIKNSKAFSLYPKLTSFNQLFDRQIPPLTKYDPSPMKVTKHCEPTASKSQRLDLAKPLNDNPSAAHYNLKRFLD